MQCSICSGRRQVDRHHVASKGMGGSKNPDVHSEANLLTLCRRCHRNVHEGGWVIERSRTELRLLDGRSGKSLMRRLYRPDFDPSEYLATFNRLESLIGGAIDLIPYLDDEQLAEAFRGSRSFGKRAWLLQGAILHEAQLRSIYSDGLLASVARQFEIGIRQAEKYALVWRTFFDRGEPSGEGPITKNVNVDAIFLEEPSWYVVAATESPAPHKWLAYAQDRKAENPRYSISDFRSDIQSVHPPSVENLVPAGDAGERRGRWWQCPWVQPFCTRDGRPIPVEECGCERDRDAAVAVAGRSP